MSYLRWKKETDGRKRLFIITNPATVVFVAIFFFLLSLPVVAWLRSLVQ